MFKSYSAQIDTETTGHPTPFAPLDLLPSFVLMDSSSASSTGGSSSGGSSTSSSTSTNSSDSGDAAIFGAGPYYNIRRGIELRQIDDDFSGLFTLQPFPAGTVLWKNRGDGPAEEKYRKIYGEDIQHLTASELKYFIRYSYQVRGCSSGGIQIARRSTCVGHVLTCCLSFFFGFSFLSSLRCVVGADVFPLRTTTSSSSLR